MIRVEERESAAPIKLIITLKYTFPVVKWLKI